MRSVVLLFTFLLLASVMPTAAAQTLVDPNPANTEWVESVLVIQQPDLTTLDISGSLLIRKYVIQGTSYDSADDIGDAYDQLVQADTFARSQGQQSDRADKFVTDMEENATNALRETLERNFAGAQITIEPAVLDRSSLEAPAGNPYEPGLSLTIAASVVRSLEDVGLGDLSLDAANAAFGAGATIASELSLSANPGHDITYVLTPPASPAGLVFANAGPADAASIDGDALVIDIDNSAGTAARSVSATFDLYDPVAVDNAPDAEEITASIVIQLGEIEQGMTSLPITAEVRSDVHAIDVGARFPDALPSTVSLSFLSADALRALHQTGAITHDDLEEANEQLRATISDNLASVVPGATVTGGLVESDLETAPATPYATSPPVGFEAEASGGYEMPDGSENADLALLIGATIKFDLDLPASKDRDTAITVLAPPGTVFATAAGGELASDKRSVAFLVPMDASEAPLKAALALRDPDARTYTKAEADNGSKFGAVIDLQDIDISIGKAIGGDFGNIVGAITVTAEMGVFEIPADFKGALPSNVELSFLTSDALRLLRSRDVVTAQQVADLEKAFMDNVSKSLKDGGFAITLEGGLASGTMDGANAAAPSGDRPIKLEARASFTKPVSGSAPATAAATLTTIPLPAMPLDSVQGLPTTYKVILPAGLTVASLKVTDGQSEQGTQDGREWFEVTPDKGKKASAAMSIGISPSFVIAKFWPILLLAVLIVFLLVGTPIALIVMRRKKKAKQE